MTDAPRTIGGVFGLVDPAARHAGGPFRTDDVYLATARAGVYLLAQALDAPQVWLPAYTCDSVYGAAKQSGKTVRYYPVSGQLGFPADDASRAWLDEVGRGDLVVSIDYFGFVPEDDLRRRAKAQGAWILDDASQAMLSRDTGRDADFLLFSPRKYLGVPDGGVLRDLLGSGVALPALVPAPTDWWLTALGATIGRRRFDAAGGDRDWFGLFQKAETDGPIGAYAMSELSRTLLHHCVDYAEVARTRCANYAQLLAALEPIALYPRLPEGTVPLGFPVRIPDREPVRQALFAEEIFPPVHWPIEAFVPSHFDASHALSREILTLPCDQRYDAQDMQRIIDIVTAQGL
ncbi:MAG: hypothetical protein AAF430_18815 [Myxococcota bacterium]